MTRGTRPPANGWEYWADLCLNGSYVALHRTFSRYYRQAAELERKFADSEHPSVLSCLGFAEDARSSLEVRIRWPQDDIETWRRLVAAGMRASVAVEATMAIRWKS
jgi:hypothetical protein